MDTLLWILVFIIGMSASFIDSAFKMGYGLATPALILLGLDPKVVVSTLLFSQLFAGFTKTIYFSIYRNVPYVKQEQEAKLNIFYIITGMLGMIFAIILVYLLLETFILLYVAIMIIFVGVITLTKKKLKFTARRFYLISMISGFNQSISAAGYGPLATYQEFMKDGDYKKTRAITSIAEAILSGFGFLLYFILFDDVIIEVDLLIILITTGMISTPFGSLTSDMLNKRKAKIIIGITSIIIGILLLLRIFSII
ncbi:MAG: sulfite exporter TauE/SafE family protein [Promethearchaeati archaeon]